MLSEQDYSNRRRDASWRMVLSAANCCQRHGAHDCVSVHDRLPRSPIGEEHPQFRALFRSHAAI